MTELFHFTCAQYLRGIHRHGLTVGDIPTDLRSGKGRCGVWLTSAPQGQGCGLSSSKLDKTRYRLTIRLANSKALHGWTTWAAAHATAETIRALERADGAAAASWHIYLGVIPPSEIVACHDMATGLEVSAWGELEGSAGVPAWRRDAWHKALLKRVDRAQFRMKSPGS